MPWSGWIRTALGALIAWGLSSALLPVPIQAAEWMMEPSFGVKGEYNDNILLTFNPHSPVYGAWFSPGTRFKYRTEVLEVEGDAAADFVKYYGEQGLDITNYYLPTTARYRTEKDQFVLDGAYIRDNTLVGELQQTGVVNRRTQRNWWNAHPQWKRSLTDRLTLDVEYQFTKATYQNAVQFNLFDYTTHLGSVGVDHKLTEKDVMSFAGYYQTYEAPFLNLDAHFYGLQLGVTHKFSETFRTNLGGGFRNIQTTQTFLGSSGQSTDLVWVFNADAQKQFERSEVSLGFSRQIYPSGVGFLVQTDHLSASVRHNITPTLTASLTGDVYWITPTLNAAVIPNSQYLYLQPMLHYRWSEWWSVELSYRHARLDVEVVDTTASQNSVYLSVTWNVPRLAWSW